MFDCFYLDIAIFYSKILIAQIIVGKIWFTFRQGVFYSVIYDSVAANVKSLWICEPYP